MRAKIVVMLVVLVVILAAVAGVSQPAGPKIIFAMKPDPATLGLDKAANLNVYQLEPPTLTAEALPGVARALFGTATKAVQTGQLLTIAGGQRPSDFLMLNPRSGYLSFDRGLADQIDGKAGNLPDEQAAQKLALDFFAKLNVMPAGADELVFDRSSRMFSASFDPATGQQGRALPQVLVLYFARQLDGIRVTGPGSKLIARFGDGGEIVGGTVRWRKATRLDGAETYGLRPVEQLQKDIAAFLRREQNQAKTITVQSMGLSYFDQDGKFIQPVIGYEAVIQRGENLTERFFGQTALLVRPVESVIPAAVSATMLEAVGKSLEKPTTQPRADGE